RGAVHRCPPTADLDRVRRRVVLHLLARPELVASGPLLSRMTDLVPSAKCRESRIPDLDPFGEKLLVYTHAVAIAPLMELSDPVDVLAELLVAPEVGDLGDTTTQDLADCSARHLQHPRYLSCAVAFGAQTQDCRSSVEVQHRSSPVRPCEFAASQTHVRLAATRRVAPRVRAALPAHRFR